jgi:hypothetical protein
MPELHISQLEAEPIGVLRKYVPSGHDRLWPAILSTASVQRLSYFHRAFKAIMKDSKGALNLDRFLPLRLTLLSNAIANEFAEAYREHGPSTPEWRTVMLLAAFPGSSSDEVAARSNIEKSVISRLIASLLHRGFIRRSLTRWCGAGLAKLPGDFRMPQVCRNKVWPISAIRGEGTIARPSAR